MRSTLEPLRFPTVKSTQTNSKGCAFALEMDSSICRSLQFPPEIAQIIALAIRPSLKSLSNFAQVCRSLCPVSTPILYKSVVLRNVGSANHFSWTISHSPDLIPLVRELQIHFHDMDEDSDDCPEDFEPTLVKLVHLESLVIRAEWFDDMKASRTTLINNPSEALPAFRSCE